VNIIFETETDKENELRSSMSQRRLNHLSLMSIESELLRKQNCCKMIQEIAC